MLCGLHSSPMLPMNVAFWSGVRRLVSFASTSTSGDASSTRTTVPNRKVNKWVKVLERRRDKPCAFACSLHLSTSPPLHLSINPPPLPGRPSNLFVSPPHRLRGPRRLPSAAAYGPPRHESSGLRRHPPAPARTARARPLWRGTAPFCRKSRRRGLATPARAVTRQRV